MRIFPLFAAALLLSGCTAALGSSTVTEPEAISLSTGESAVDAAIAAAEARSTPYTLAGDSEMPTDVDLTPGQAVDAADALREAVGLAEQEGAAWTVAYRSGDTIARTYNGEDRACYEFRYTNEALIGTGVDYRFMEIRLDAVTGAVRRVDLYWPDGIGSLSSHPDDYDALARAGAEWLAGDGLERQILDFAAALGFRCGECTPLGEVQPPEAKDGTISVGRADFVLTTDDGRRLLVVTDAIARKPTALGELREDPSLLYEEADEDSGWYTLQTEKDAADRTAPDKANSGAALVYGQEAEQYRLQTEKETAKP